jgi:hypothetical protein
MEHVLKIESWVVVLTALVSVSGCIAIHYEMLRACERWLPRIGVRHRPRVLFVVSARGRC